MKKLFFAALLAVSIAGCGGSSGGSGDSDYSGPYRLSQVDVYTSGEARAATEFMSSYELTYDDSNYLSSVTYYDEDGDVTQTFGYTFDENGNLTGIERSGYDAVYVYNEDNNPVSLTVDTDGDGETDDVTLYQYNAEGELVQYDEYEQPGDVLDSSTRLFYNEEGQISQVEYDSDADSVYEEVHSFTYSASGKLTEDSETENGINDELRTYFYDSEDRLSSIEEDSNYDSTADSVREFEYDENGLIVKITEDDNNDGNIDMEAVLTYEQGEENGTHLVWYELYGDMILVADMFLN